MAHLIRLNPHRACGFNSRVHSRVKMIKSTLSTGPTNKTISIYLILLTLILGSCAPMYIPVTQTPNPPASPTLPAPSTPTASPTIEPPCFRVTALEALHIRSGPSEKSRVLGYAFFGQRLTMIQAGAWSKIRTADKLTGYVNSRYIQKGCAP